MNHTENSTFIKMSHIKYKDDAKVIITTTTAIWNAAVFSNIKIKIESSNRLCGDHGVVKMISHVIYNGYHTVIYQVSIYHKDFHYYCPIYKNMFKRNFKLDIFEVS